MQEGFYKHIIAFLVGWIILPRIFFFLIGFIFLYLGFGQSAAILYAKGIEIMIIVLLFFLSRAMALGYLLNFLLELIGIYPLISGKFSA